MYAVPANPNGRRIPLGPVPCIECGSTLFFSHDEIKGDYVHRYASCKNLHSIFFTSALAEHKPLEVEQPGFLIDDTTPGWQEQIPDWARWPAEKVADAPYCMQCGVQMMRAGSGHACPSCGSTSGFG